MTPTTNPPKSPQTTAAGIVSIVMGSLTMFCQIWGATHGAAVDPTSTVMGVGLIGSGVGLVKAKDANK